MANNEKPSKRFDKLLILDLDETIIFAAEEALPRPADFRTQRFHVYKRPGLEEFLSRCFEWFEVRVWTSSSTGYAEAVVPQVFPRPEELQFVWTRERCVRRFDPEEALPASIPRRSRWLVKWMGTVMNAVLMAQLWMFLGPAEGAWSPDRLQQDTAELQLLRQHLMHEVGPACDRTATPTIDFKTGLLKELIGKGTLVPLLRQLVDGKDWNWPGDRPADRGTAVRAVFFTLSEVERQFQDKSVLEFLRSISLDRNREPDLRESAAQYSSAKDREGLDHYYARVLTEAPEHSRIVLSAIDVCRGKDAFIPWPTLCTPELLAALRSFRRSIAGTEREAGSGAWMDGIIADLEKGTLAAAHPAPPPPAGERPRELVSIPDISARPGTRSPLGSTPSGSEASSTPRTVVFVVLVAIVVGIAAMIVRRRVVS